MSVLAVPAGTTRPVPTQDLEAHHAPLQKELAAAAARVIQSGRYILGPEVDALEKEVAAASGVPHAVGLSSGTDALVAMLMALEIGPGDEVITTPFTFFATAGAIARVGARPVFADIDPATYNLDAASAVARIGPRTRAVITVHLFGRVASGEVLERACAERGIPILEDACQAIGAVDGAGRRVGKIGKGAALSFFPSKNLGGFGDGGMVLTDDAGFADKLKLVRTHGARPRYHHIMVGGNFRLDEMQAALLRVKLPHLERWTAGRRRVAAQYRSRLTGLPLRLPPDEPGCVWNQYVISVDRSRRDALAQQLASAGITTAVYYPEPLHLQPCFAALGARPGDLTVAERACGEVLALPIYPELTDEMVGMVSETIRSFLAAR
jgi:dTDP-4-amino-4,6-dideoxygalactose transaminase